jgi:hypothetical protein
MLQGTDQSFQNAAASRIYSQTYGSNKWNVPLSACDKIADPSEHLQPCIRFRLASLSMLRAISQVLENQILESFPL